MQTWRDTLLKGEISKGDREWKVSYQDQWSEGEELKKRQREAEEGEEVEEEDPADGRNGSWHPK